MAASYTGGITAALSKPSTRYHGPLTRAELSSTTVCLPWFSQSEIDEFLATPSRVLDGQFWGRRLLTSTRSGFVGQFVGPDEPWDKSQAEFGRRMELCAQMMRTAPADTMMAMMVPRSEASAFLQGGNCGDFTLAPDLQFSNLEVGPQLLAPMRLMGIPLSEVLGVPESTVRERFGAEILQTTNAAIKFLSATVEYQALEQRYLGRGVGCSDSSGANDSTQLTLTQQAGVAADRRPSRAHSSAALVVRFGTPPLPCRLRVAACAGRVVHH